jgi:hypothetical protein
MKEIEEMNLEEINALLIEAYARKRDLKPKATKKEMWTDIMETMAFYCELFDEVIEITDEDAEFEGFITETKARRALKHPSEIWL